MQRRLQTAWRWHEKTNKNHEECKHRQLERTDAIKEVLDPLFKDFRYLTENGVPLHQDDVKDIFTNLKWEEFVWDDRSLEVRDFNIPYINGYLWVDR